MLFFFLSENYSSQEPPPHHLPMWPCPVPLCPALWLVPPPPSQCVSVTQRRFEAEGPSGAPPPPPLQRQHQQRKQQQQQRRRQEQRLQRPCGAIGSACSPGELTTKRARAPLRSALLCARLRVPLGLAGLGGWREGGGLRGACDQPVLASPRPPRVSALRPSRRAELAFRPPAVVRYNGSLPNGDRGRRKSRFALFKRPKANGVKPSTVHIACTPQAAKAISNKDQHSISYTLSRAQTVVVEYTHDSNTDMFQIGRSTESPIDFVVTDTVPGSQSNSDTQSVQSTISRFACRIICERNPPFTARIYAAGFDSSKNIFLGKTPSLEYGEKYQYVEMYSVYEKPDQPNREERWSVGPMSLCGLDVKLDFMWTAPTHAFSPCGHVCSEKTTPIGPKSHFLMVLTLFTQPVPFVHISWLVNKAISDLFSKDL
ncbi:hypothetical protein STEG23_001535 [Scotinomys teguina]